MAKAPSGKKVLERIDRRLQALELTDNRASQAATGSRDTLRTIRRNIAEGKQRGVSTETLEKFAPVLETTVEWLTNEIGPEVAQDHISSADVLPEEEQPTIPVRGYVGAGALAYYLPLADDELDRVPAPPGSTEHTIALEIRGTSLGELFDRWLVIVDDVRSPVTSDLIGKTCVVGLSDDRILVKKLKRGAAGRYDLLSNTEPPIKDVEILWAAKVKNMVPR